MYITRIEKSNGKRYRVYSEDGYLFSLYGKELKRYNIEENTDLDDSLISEIYDEVIFKRAKERALYLLDRQSYSESGIKRKLVSGGTPEHIVDKVIEFLKKYNYLDDELYVSIYVESYIKKKSIRQIYNDLQHKGIDKQLIDEYFESNSDAEDYERDCFISQYNRYIKGKNLADPAIKQKVFRYFYGKGFSVCLIEETMKENS